MSFMRRKIFPHKKRRKVSREQWKSSKCSWSFFEEFLLLTGGARFAPREVWPCCQPFSCQGQLKYLSATSVHGSCYRCSCYTLTTLYFLLPFCYCNKVIHSFLSLSLFFKKSFPPLLAWDVGTLGFSPPALTSLFNLLFPIY